MIPYKPIRLLLHGLLAAALIVPFSAGAASNATWSPRASEQLIKLPGDFLKKAVENDFASSPLASAITDSDERIYLKKSTLRDLQKAVGRAEGDMKIELEHQLLAEKRAYIEQMQDDQGLRRRRAETKIRLYEKLLGRLNVKERGITASRARLIDQQSRARQRMEATASLIDTQLLQSSMTPESRYAKDYARNLEAVEKLVQAINTHPMNQQPEIDGQPISRQDYLRTLIASNQSDLALLDQQRTVLGYMAKLVSLDALALSEGIQRQYDDTAENDDNDTAGDLASAVDLFTNP